MSETKDVLDKWDGRLYCRTLKNKLGYRQLTKPLPCGNSYIPTNFVWNGSSSGLFRGIFPQWKHPIASCRHDWRCALAKNKEERKLADKLFKQDVGIGGTKFEQIIGYIGVRLGAFLGIGNNF